MIALPFDQFPERGRHLLGRPRAGTGSSRTGYGLSLQRLTGQNSCAYCGVDLVGDYHRWLLLNVDHVVPRGEAIRLGIPAEFYEDAINLVLACSGCNGYLNRYRSAAEPSTGWTVEEFADLRDLLFRDRFALIAVRRDQERAAFAGLSKPSDADSGVRPTARTVTTKAAPAGDAGASIFIDNDPGYAEWLDRNPDGWVTNTTRAPSAGYLVLHRATCHTIRGNPPRGSTWTADFIKVCSEDLNSLHDWARRATGGALKPCGRCRPLEGN